MRKRNLGELGIEILSLAVAFAFIAGGSGFFHANASEEIVAVVNGENIGVRELRESLGRWGKAASATDIPVERKKEALERLIDARLVEQTARSKRWDKAEEFKKRAKVGEKGLLISALFRMEIASRGSIREEEMQKLGKELTVKAREEVSARIDVDAIGRIGKGEKAEDDVVLATAGDWKIRYGDVKTRLQGIHPGGHGGRDLAGNPEALRSMVDRELTGKALAEYARKRKVEGSKWMGSARREMERAILIDLFTEKVILKEIRVTERQIEEVYARHSGMLTRDGRETPLSEVREEIRRIVEREQRKKTLHEYRERLRGKAKIKIDDKNLRKA
jgi:hypothetical protein